MSFSVQGSSWDSLTQSHYGKVVFDDTKEYNSSNDLECYFLISSDIVCSPNDYIGIFMVGYNDLNECIISQKVPYNVSTKQMVIFPAKDLPKDHSKYYQFVYASEHGVVHGASTHFELKGSAENSDASDDDFYLIDALTDVSLLPLDIHKGCLEKVQKLQEEKVCLDRRLRESEELLTQKMEACKKRAQELEEEKLHLAQKCRVSEEQLNEKLKSKSNEVAKLFMKVQENNKEQCSILAIKIKELTDKNDRLEKQVKELQELIDSLEQTNDCVRKDFEQAMSLQNEQVKVIEKLQLRNQVMEKQEKELRESLNIYAMRGLQSGFIEIDLPEQSIDEVNNKLVDANKKVENLQSQLSIERKNNVDLRSTLKTFILENQSIESAENQLAELQIEISAVKTERDDLIAQKVALDAYQQISDERVNDLTMRLTEAAEIYKEQHKEILSLKKKLLKLQKLPNEVEKGKDVTSTSSASGIMVNIPSSAISCPICCENFSALDGTNVQLENHLQKVHHQELCPICHALFDPNVPIAVIEKHIETHFK